MAEQRREVTILLAEDDAGHARLIERNLRKAGVHNELIHFHDGQEAWEFLDQRLVPGRAYVLLLDLRMPRMDGIEVLRRVKADETLKNMPVVILTSSDDPRDIRLCHDLGCNNYLSKPVAFDQFSEVIRRLGLFVLVIQIDPIEPEREPPEVQP